MFANLPTEMIVEILSYLTEKEMMSKIAPQNRRLYFICKDLCRRIDIHANQSLTEALRRIIQNPRLRTVKVGYHDLSNEIIQCALTRCPELQTLDVLKSSGDSGVLLANSNVNIVKNLKSVRLGSFCSGSDLISVFATHCTNLEKLEINALLNLEDEEIGYYLETIFRKNFCTLKQVILQEGIAKTLIARNVRRLFERCTKLKSLSIQCGDASSMYSCHAIVDFSYLPNLKFLDSDKINSDALKTLLLECSSTLELVRIVYCYNNLTENVLEVLFSLPNLREVQIELWSRDDKVTKTFANEIKSGTKCYPLKSLSMRDLSEDLFQRLAKSAPFLRNLTATVYIEHYGGYQFQKFQCLQHLHLKVNFSARNASREKSAVFFNEFILSIAYGGTNLKSLHLESFNDLHIHEESLRILLILCNNLVDFNIVLGSKKDYSSELRAHLKTFRGVKFSRY